MKKIIFIFSILMSVLSMAEDKNSAEPKNSTPDEVSSKTRVPTGRYVTGGIIGSTFGFGIGHAIQGRYAEKGWIFTVTDGAGWILLNHANCFRKRDSNSQDRAVREQSDCENVGEGILGAGLLIGFRVWEVLDLWTQAKPYSKDPEVMFLPTAAGAAVVFNYRF